MPAWKNPNEESVSSYLNRVAKGQAGVNPKAVTLSRTSNNPRAAAIGQDMVARQLDQNQRNTESAADSADDLTRQNNAKLRQNESFARQRALVDEAARKRAVRAAAAQGAATETDIETGSRTVSTHLDGEIKYKAGPIAGAPLVPVTQTTAVRDTQTNEIRPTPATNPLIPDSGALGATGGESRTSLLQPIRDDRGNESLVKPVTTTDKRGVEYTNKTDPVTGQPGKQAVGIDPVAQAKALKDADIAQRAAEVDLRANGVNQARLQFDPQWKTVDEEYQKATKGYESLAKEPITRGPGGMWIKTDPNTGKVSYPAAPEVAIYQRRLAEAKQRVGNITKQYDAMRPQFDNIERNEREIRDAKLKLAEEKIRQDAGLPDDDGGIASILAQSTGQIEPSEEQAALSELDSQLPVSTTSASNGNSEGEQAGTDAGQSAAKAILSTDTSNPEAVVKAFSGLQGVDGITVEKPSAAGSFINKDGKWIGTVKDGGANQKVIVLNDYAKDDAGINKTVALGVTSGAPVYLADNGQKKDVAKEAQEAAALFTEISQSPDQRTANALIKQKGYDRAGILQKVNDGSLSIQTGEAMLKHFYGDTLKSPSPEDPQAFNQWLAEKSKGKTGETVATRWGNRTNLADKQEVKREYLRDWYSANRGKPGVTRESMKRLYGEDVTKDATVGERIQSAGKTGLGMGTDLLGSASGLLVVRPAVGIGAAEAALFGSEDGKRIMKDMWDLSARDTANWTQTAKRNLKAWTTDEGRQVASGLNQSVKNLQNVIDEESEKAQPDKGRIAGAAQQATNAALALHGLAPDPEWPITADNLDPDKDPTLGAALARYVQTADPKEMELYKERLMMNNGRRQFSGEMEKRTAGLGRFGSAVVGGMYAGWQEVAAELVADAATLVTGGAAKGLQMGLKGAGMAGKASRVAKLAESIGEAATAFGKAGVRAESLVNPLTRGQKAANMGIQGSKALATGAVGEGGEEVLTEVGADQPDFVQAFAGGAIAPFALAPAQYVASRIASPERNAQAQLQAENVRWAKNYNATMADQPGFKAVTPEQAMLARSFVDPQQFEESVTALAIAKQRVDALESQPIEQSMAQAELDRATTELAAQTQGSIEATNEIEAVEDPAQKAYYQGIAKVATGNEATLTTAERSAIAGGTTPDGQPLFAEVAGPDGQPRTVLTDEAKANLMLDMPAVGSLVRTTESDAILSSLGGQPSVTSPANEQLATPGVGAASGDTQGAGEGIQGNAGIANQGYVPPVQAQPVPNNGGTTATSIPVPQTQQSAAQLDAGEYEAYRVATLGAPDIQTVVQDAFASGQPVSITMARSARQAPPKGYAKRGALLVPLDAQTQPQATPERKKAPSKVSNQTREVSGRLKAETERAIPGLKGRINVTDQAFNVPSGGVVANSDGTITIVLPDVEREIKGSNPKAVFKSLQQTIQRHEAVHVVQYEAVRDIWKQKGSKGDYGQFFQDWYGKIAAELPIEAIAKAREIYGAQAWDSIGSDANRAAELVRMLVEAKLDPTKTEDFSELFRAVETGQNKTLIETIRQAIRVLTKLVTEGKLSKEAQKHVEQITELYNALVAGGEASVTPVTNGTSERGGNTGADSVEPGKSDAQPDMGRTDDAKDESVEGSRDEKVLGQQTKRKRRRVDNDNDRAFYLSPVVSGINAQGGLVSRSRGKEVLGERFEGNKSQWDDAPRFANPAYNSIYSKTGEITPNIMADALFKEGVIPEPTANALWAALSKAEKDANSFVRNTKDAEARAARGEREETNEERFEAANQQTDSNTPLAVEDFTKESVGGTITVGGEPMRIMSVETNPLTGEVESVVLQDGSKFGRQVLESGETVFVEADQAEDGMFSSPTVDQPATDAEELKPFSKASTQINLPDEIGSKVIEFGNSIPEEDIYSEKGYGREDEPHVTVLYGLTTDSADQAQKALANFGPIKFKLGETSIFKNDDYDVLKVDVISPDLRKANKALRDKVPFENDFPDYKPHVTIAYLKKGTGEKYAGQDPFKGLESTSSEVLYSGKDRTKTPIDLGQPFNLSEAATAPDATQKLGQVKVGTMNALGAYRALTAKRERTGSLSAKEEEQLLAAETALGQKLAFDMEAVKGDPEAKPEAPKPTPPKQGPKSTQQSMMLGEEGKGGQMSLLSSPSEPSSIDESTPYEVYDRQTGEVVWKGTYAQRATARMVKDRRDNKYGGYRFATRFSKPETETLGSSPSQDAVDQALASMPQIYRDVFQAVSAGKTPAQVMKEFNLREIQVKNILRAVETKMKVGVSAASPDGLNPVMRDGKIMGGRPDLAGSTRPTSAAISQIRNEAGAPAREDFAEINNQAREVVNADPKGTLERLAAKKERGESFTLEEVAQAKIITRETVLAGADNTPEMRAKLALFGVDFIEQGTDDARKLAIRFDPDLSPAERFAQYVGAELYVPPAKVRERLKGAKNKDEIIKSWMADVDATKDFLKAQGYDIDASLKAYRDRQTAQAEAAAESPRVQATIEDTIDKLSKREKTVVEALRGGSTYEVAGGLQGMTADEAKAVYSKWHANLKTAMTESAKKFLNNSLAASPSSSVMDQILSELGILDPEMIPVNEADKPRVKKLIDATKPKKEAPAKPKKPTLVNPTPEAQAALDDAWEKFQNTTQSWKAFTKGLKLDPINETTGDYTEDRPFTGQGQFFREPINETQGTFDINDPVAQKEVAQAFSTRNASLADKIMEFWKMSILSGIQTPIVNTSSNAMHAAYRLLPRRAVEAGVNTILSSVGLGSQESATFGEFSVMAKHLKQAAALAGRMALQSWKTEGYNLFEAYANASDRQSEFGKAGLGGEKFERKLGGPVGNIMNALSFRHLTAADEFVKFFAGQIEAAAQAHRIARVEEGLRGDAYAERLKELLVPGSKAWVRAIDEAEAITFQSPIDGTNPRLIGRLDQLAELVNSAKGKPYIGKPLELLVPFVKTPLKIFQQALEMTPIGAGLAIFDAAHALNVRYNSGKISTAEAKQEAAKLYNKARLVSDLSNQLVGIAAYYAISSMVEGDDDELPFITGTQPFDSTKKGERENAMSVMPPMSIRIGNTFLSYKRFEPFATVFASMADLAREINRHGGLKPGVATQWLAGFKSQLTDKTFLTGISNLAQAWDNPERFGANLATNIVTGFVPNFIKQPIRLADPYVRDTKPQAGDNIFEGMAKSLGYSLAPGYAPIRTDVWGRPLMRNRGELIGGSQIIDSAARIVDPTNLTINPKPDPLDVWIYNYNDETPSPSDRLSITPISNKLSITVEGESKPRNITLTEEEYQQANEIAGKAARAALGDGWENRPYDVTTKELIETTVREAQRMERSRLKMQKISEGLPPLEK